MKSQIEKARELKTQHGLTIAEGILLQLLQEVEEMNKYLSELSAYMEEIERRRDF